MTPFFFYLILVLLLVAALLISKKLAKTEKTQEILLVISPLLTILCHYSSLVYHWLQNGTALDFLKSNPNLVLPIYPCNVVMWCCLFYGFLRNKKGRLGRLLSDFVFWFGLVACLVGMFANVDFIRNPDFSDYDVVKSVVAHAFMFYNVLLLPIFKQVKVDLPKNMLHLVLSVVGMFLIGQYCNLVYEVLTTREMTYLVNSMFLLHSPFEQLPFLKFPLISLIGLALFFGIFALSELKAYPKGNRWISRYKKRKKTQS